MKVFLSHTFRNSDRELVEQVEALLSSHDVQMVTGRRLAGQAVDDEIFRRIEETDALVAVMTRRETLGDAAEGRFTTHPYVRDELNHARAKEKLSIAILEQGVEIEGAYRDRERIAFDRAQPLPTFLALSESLRQWKQALGQTAILRIMPSSIAGELAQGDGQIQCRYRFRRDGRPTDWLDGHPYPEAGGVTLYVNGVVSLRDLIEIEIRRDGNRAWWSEATPQYIPVQLEGGA